MIVYIAGNSCRIEDIDRILETKSKRWGVLMSYKDLQTKTGNGSARFRRLIERKKPNKDEDNE